MINMGFQNPDGKTDYSINWISVTNYVLRKMSWIFTFLNKIISK